MRKLTTLILLLCSLQVFAVDYYVKTGGGTGTGLDDANAWSYAHFQTRTFAAGDNIYFKRGDTFYGGFTVGQSGTSGSRITFGAYGTGDKPTFTGFVTATGWTHLGGNIWESNAIAEAGSTVTMVKQGNTSLTMGRFPNTGWRTISTRTASPYTAGQSVEITDATLTNSPNWTGAEVVVRKGAWVIDRGAITNHATTSITYTTPTTKVPSVGNGYFITNHPSTLDTQGEWYYNSSTKKLQIYSTTTPTDVKVSTVARVVVSNSRNYITFDNLHIEGSNERSIFAIGNTVHITNCDINYSGFDGIHISSSSPSLLIENCNITNTNNKAIHMDNSLSGNANAVIRGNTIDKTALIAGMGGYSDGQGMALDMRSNSGLVEYNTLTNSGYLAIYFNGTNCNIRYNLVDGFASVKDDGGGIYTFGTTMSGTTINNNIVLNGIGAPEGRNKGYLFHYTEGIYLDNGSTGVTITNNTIANMPSAGIRLNDAQNNTITNNTIYNCLEGVRYNRLSASYPTYTMQSNSLSGNRVFSLKPDQVAFVHDTDIDDVATAGTSNNNFWIIPSNDKRAPFYTTFVSSSQRYHRSYSLSGWQTVFSKDLNSGLTPATITPYTYSTVGSNKYANGTFDANISGVTVSSPSANAAIAWDNTNQLGTGGSLRLTYSNSNYTGRTNIARSIGAVDPAKHYILKFSAKGSADRMIGIFLEQSGSPYDRLTEIYWRQLTTTAQNHELLISFPNRTDANATLKIWTETEDGTMYFDNFEFYEATVTFNTTTSTRLDYNATQSAANVNLGASYVDAAGTTKTGTISIPAYSSEALIWTAAGSPPPVAPVATAATNIAQTTFTANWNSVGDATSYRLDVSANSGFSSFLTGYNDLTVNSTLQNVTVPSANTTYYYRVRAVNANGTSASSNTINVTTLVAGTNLRVKTKQPFKIR